MNKELEERYRTIPYAEFTHAQTHPTHVGGIARLYGLRPAEPRTARILELATGRGSNLNFIARTLPEADCLGVDLVEDAIDSARKQADEQGLKNVRFESGDLLEADFGEQQFDYIIAHGFMAWTPEPVQQRILEVCRDHLDPDGVALVSYNAMPGSATRDALRQLFLLEMNEAKTEPSPDEQLAAMESVMGFFDSTLPSIESMHHAADLKHSLKVLRSKPREVILHDEGGVVSEPLYLLQFTQWAGENGLAYIADTDLSLDLLAVLPEPVRREIAARKMTRLKALQYVDYLRNCPFRSSLLCRAEQAKNIPNQPDPQALLDLNICSLLAADQPLTTFDRSVAKFRLVGQPFIAEAPTDGIIETTDPLQKTVLHAMEKSRHQAIPFERVWENAMARCGIATDSGELNAIAKIILESVCLGRMKLTLEPAW